MWISSITSGFYFVGDWGAVLRAGPITELLVAYGVSIILPFLGEPTILPAPLIGGRDNSFLCLN